MPLGKSAALQISSPYISRAGSASIARSTNSVGNVIRGPEPSVIVSSLNGLGRGARDLQQELPRARIRGTSFASLTRCGSARCGVGLGGGRSREARGPAPTRLLSQTIGNGGPSPPPAGKQSSTFATAPWPASAPSTPTAPGATTTAATPTSPVGPPLTNQHISEQLPTFHRPSRAYSSTGIRRMARSLSCWVGRL